MVCLVTAKNNGACTEVQAPNKMQTHKQVRPKVLLLRLWGP
jgi:hypothetical protein